jgi:hypothetical protein
MIYIGVDLHLRFCYMTALDASGTIQQHGRVANDGVSLRQYFAGLKSSSKKAEETAVAVEACGFWAPFVEQVEALVERVVLVHPARVKAMASAKLKNDPIDSAILAQLLRAAGEVYAVFAALTGLGGCIFVWFSGTSPMGILPGAGVLKNQDCSEASAVSGAGTVAASCCSTRLRRAALPLRPRR